MDPIIGGALISAGSGLVGGLIGSSANKEAAEKQWELGQHQIAMQKEFAKNGIQWKVQDAIAAGIHPLAALGAQTSSFSPVSVGISPDDSMANAVKGMGQDIGRAVAAQMTDAQRRLQNLSIRNAELEVEGKAIDNSIRASQLQKLNAVGPAVPTGLNAGMLAAKTGGMPGGGDPSEFFFDGQGDAKKLIKINPASRSASQPGRPAQEAGWVPDVGYARTDDGFVAYPSKDVKERIEDVLPYELEHWVRTRIPPLFGYGKPANPLPKGWDYSYNGWKQAWEPVVGTGTYPWKRWSDWVTKWQDHPRGKPHKVPVTGTKKWKMPAHPTW